MNNALSLFTSATIRLTFWYVSILMTLSILFSVIIFLITTAELSSNINSLQQALFGLNNSIDVSQYQALRIAQVGEVRANLIAALVVTNLGIFITGSIGCYHLAKRNLRPIEEMHEAQSRFTSDASHELRTPLASMKVELEVALRDANATKTELRDTLASSLEEVNKLTNLSHNLLQLSRLEHNKIHSETVILHDAVMAVRKRFSEQARLQVTGSSSLSVRANQSNVEELLTILLDNAFKYSPRNTPVTLTLIKRRGMAGFVMTNEGKGIDPQALPHIFDRFYRTDRSRSSHETTGYGLGLSLAKKIVELHSGDLTVSSGINAPTTFTVLLPSPQKITQRTRRPRPSV